MSECLGLYIENNLIKYAKVSKEKDNIKIEAHGMKFFDDIEETVEQIVKETYSYKTPLSVNISNEKYTTSSLFSLLNKNDLKKAIQTEFEYFCNEKSKNKNATDYKYIIMPDLQDKDKVKILYAYVDKSNIVERLQRLDGYSISSLAPIGTSIGNLCKENEIGDSAIINLESKTTVSILSNGTPYVVEQIEDGVGSIIAKIAEKENSFSKAYEIFKNTTIYTKAGQNLQLEENDYLDDIMPTLFKIIEKTKEIIEKSEVNVKRIYISGTGAAINNIDLYFQENFMQTQCEILIPYFIQRTNTRLNVKDYIEENSAIAIAMEGLKGRQEQLVNFSNKGATLDKIKEIMKKDLGGNPNKTPKEKKLERQGKMKLNINADLDFFELLMSRAVAAVLVAVIIYSGAVIYLAKNINTKQEKAEEVITDTKEKIAKVEDYTTLVEKKTEEYNKVLEKIEEKENTQSENKARRNAIPNLLNQIMFAVPDEVQILSIENTTNKTIKIEAESKEYQQLGYFKAALQNDAILANITSTSGTYKNGIITVTITGELVY